QLREACLEASRDLRLRRTAAYSHPVKLFTDVCTATFWPVEADRTLSVRFAVHFDAAVRVDGHLHLRGTTDPLPAVFDGGSAAESEALAHAFALTGFAALTVLPEFAEPPSRTARRQSRGSPRRPAANRVLPRQNRRRPPPGASLVPTGRTASAHWVVGHI